MSLYHEWDGQRINSRQTKAKGNLFWKHFEKLNLKNPHNRQFFQQTGWQSISDIDFQSSNAQWVVPDVAPVPLDLWWAFSWSWNILTPISYLVIFRFKLQMRGTRIHLWLLNTGELACDLKSVISEAVSWKSSRNHNISYFNRTNNFLPLIYLYVWLTLLDWIQFAIDDLISGHICFHSYHCCVYVWKVTTIQNFKLVVLWIFCGEFIGVW